MTNFDDTTIESIFGADDAENENPQRFKEYFYKNRAFESLTAALPVRILVGHKGVGKSALLRKAFMEDEENGVISIWLRPNDIVHIKAQASGHNDFIMKIEAWKRGLLIEIVRHVFEVLYGEGSRAVIDEVADASPKSLLRLLKRGLLEYSKAPLTLPR
jgi:hypothetical protein